jgi:hypothetical protein
MDHSTLYSDPYYPSFCGALASALDAWAVEGQRASMEAWVASHRLQTAMDLLTVGAQDQAVQLARTAWEATAKLGGDEELDGILERLAPIEAAMQQPAPLPLGGQHGAAWVQDFLKGVKSACVAIDGTDDLDSTVEPHYIPDSDMDAMAASVVYLSAWRVPGHQAGEEYVHWAVFGGTGQPPPQTGTAGLSRFSWVPGAI